MSPQPTTEGAFAFGRHISPTRGQKLSGNDLRFTFERQHTKDALPYWQQGDEDFNRTLPSAQRAALRTDERVVKELERFWRVFRSNGQPISKEQYVSVHQKFSAVLIPGLTSEEAANAAETDWVADAAGGEQMHREQFYDCLFELCDMYTTGIDGEVCAARGGEGGRARSRRPRGRRRRAAEAEKAEAVARAQATLEEEAERRGAEAKAAGRDAAEAKEATAARAAAATAAAAVGERETIAKAEARAARGRRPGC